MGAAREEGMDHDQGAARHPGLERIKRAYLATALHSFNLAALIVLVNVALAIVMALRPASRAENPSAFPDAALAEAYAPIPLAEAKAVLDETWNQLELEAKPWVHFGEARFSGKYVNVSAEGVRSNGPAEAGPGAEGGSSARSPGRGPGPAPPAEGGAPLVVFVFGGSTTFGYGVPDRDTIPSNLERVLRARHPERRVRVVNHGHGYYYSSQEQALFTSLLRRRVKPDIAVFLDGTNEPESVQYPGGERRFDEPWNMATIRALWPSRKKAQGPLLPEWVPLGRAARWLRERGASHAPAPPPPPSREDAELIFDNYLENQRLIAGAAAGAGVAAYFFWQPNPVYAYDLSRHLFAGRSNAADDALHALVYEAMARRGAAGVVDLSGLFRDYPAPAYVDFIHYSPAACRRIAEAIADAIVIPPPR
jgi:hypothetical protein